jgi:NADH-quinone oxidoreductase subunit H
MAEYGSMLAVSILASILFLGAWNGPIPITSLLGLTYENGRVAGYLGGLAGCLNILLKGTIGVSVMIWIRWTVPRLRIDQVMTTCLKYCMPIVAAMFLGVVLWQLWLPSGLGILPAQPYSDNFQEARYTTGPTNVADRGRPVHFVTNTEGDR